MARGLYLVFWSLVFGLCFGFTGKEDIVLNFQTYYSLFVQGVPFSIPDIADPWSSATNC